MADGTKASFKLKNAPSCLIIFEQKEELNMTYPLISGYCAALIGILQMGLMMTVGLARRAGSVSVGDGGDVSLLMKIRRHGNLTENAPIFLILLAFLEMTGGSLLAVKIFAGLFIMARLSHAYALSGPETPAAARAFGAFGTLIGIAGTAGTLAWHLSGLA